MAERLTDGENYSIDRDGRTIRCRVWSRRDLSSARGAELAEEKIEWFGRLASGNDVALCFDLSEAPRVTGPRTQEALARMLAAWESARKPVAVIAGESELQRLQLQRIALSAAPAHAQVFATEEQGDAWLASRTAGGGVSD